jgi:hypothetical protein
MRGLLGTIIRRGVDGDPDGDILHPPRQFDVRREAERAAQTFLSTYGDLLSCFRLDGDFGLWETMQSYIQSKGLLPDVLDAVNDGDEAGYRRAILRSQEQAFVDLYENRNALARLQLIEHLPAEAMAEYSRMRNAIDSASSANVVPSPQVEKAPAVPVVTETPVETCAREFRELPSQAWKRKWLDNRKNRPAADQAAAEGRI